MNELTRSPAAVIPVSLLVSSARLLIERQLGLAWIGGEISNCMRAASGHLYFVLKDERAQVRCVLFRSKALLSGVDLRDGLQVEVRATPTIYEARGEFQLNVETVRLAGVGALYERFEKLKARLEARGWFAPARKRALPAFPRSIGVVTSPRGAALRDVLSALARRLSSARVIVYPAGVQGAVAASELAQAVRLANRRDEVDVLIVCRGGGSIEDLWPFNEEALAAAIVASRLAVVSAVGHETDFTICDFVADARAATPTAAAALVAPDVAALRRTLAALAQRHRRAALRALETRMQRLDGLAPRLLHPAARLDRQRTHLRALAARLSLALDARVYRAHTRIADQQRRWLAAVGAVAMERSTLQRLGARVARAARWQLSRRALRLDALDASLRHLDPTRVLERGYAIVTSETGAVVSSGDEVASGDAVGIAFARGHASAVIVRSEPA